jgi:menaquinol-cytochrome c reductase cytochrome b subunit
MSFLPRLGRRRATDQSDDGGNGADRTPEIPGALRRGRNGANGAAANGGNGRRGGLVDRTALKEQATEVPVSALGWLDERTGASPFARAFLFRKVPKGTNWFYTLGSATMFAFVSQAVTGVFLAMFYTPSPTEAYESISRITNEVFLGELVRGMHRWGATVMIVLIFLHMGRVFFFGAYKYPRELNWVIGVVLLVLTLAMGFTGYLLPFDQRSFWATVVGVNINASGPIMGPYLADFLRAGPEFGVTTLPRFYSIHMLLLPGLIIALIGAHLYLVAKLGTTAPPWLKAEKRRELAKTEI